MTVKYDQGRILDCGSFLGPGGREGSAQRFLGARGRAFLLRITESDHRWGAPVPLPSNSPGCR
jgi:hypothetical protein